MKVERKLEAEVRLEIDDHYARVRHDGGVHLCSGSGRLYVVPDEVDSFVALLESLIKELELL